MALLGLGVLAAVSAPQIDHIVLLMEENRAFDHMCGFFNGVNGLTGSEFNPVNTSEPNGAKVYVDKTSPYIGPFDPDHSTHPTTEKIFGDACLYKNCNVPTMDGFIEFAVKKHPLEQAKSLMNMFTPDRLPVMNALASEFALFDRFFAAHPGPTWPNRLFQLMGTSKGDTETSTFDPKTFLYTGRTVFDIVEEAGHDWAFYYADAPLEMAMIEKLTLHPGKVKGWRAFKRDIAEGKLPKFSWVNPRWFVNESTGEGANDQHPDHDVRLGEALMKEVYEELRASPKWNNTALIITYDEHGGFYDHVPPPMNIPAPDNSTSFPDKGFQFNRLGVRIPTLLISPWVAKGTVIGAPLPSEKPANNSEFDLTSVIATVRKLVGGTKPLTKRDAWAASFEGRLSEPEPRTDCPLTLPDAPKSLGAAHAAAEAAQPINDLQTDILKAFRTLAGKDEKTHPLPSLQGEAGPWIKEFVDQALAGEHIFSDQVVAP
eukprot:m.448498 g.448498  ORF g.448498 m.448498 type:complete len:486 (+) comp19671_c0_seq1:46-1503(+)